MSACSLRCLGVVVALVFLVTSVASSGSAVEETPPIDLHEAIDSGTIDVKLIVKNGQQARIVAKNNTDQPLTIQVPEAFAAVPVLAQTTQHQPAHHSPPQGLQTQPQLLLASIVHVLNFPLYPH